MTGGANVRHVKIYGIPQPQFVPGAFPGEGLSFRPSQRGAGGNNAQAETDRFVRGNGVDVCEERGFNEVQCVAIACCAWHEASVPGPVDVGACKSAVGRNSCWGGGVGIQGGGDISYARVRSEDAALVASNFEIAQQEGHLIAYAGYPVTMQYSAVTNWCQSEAGQLIGDTYGNSSCSADSNGSVSVAFGTLPSHNVSFQSLQRGAITDVLLTFDNPFAAARPGHDHPTGYEQRNFNGNPHAADAMKLNYSRIPYNLNLGAGGAHVSLWVKRLTNLNIASGVASQLPRPDDVITDFAVSANKAEEEALRQQAYQQVAGNLNTEAGGDDVYLWYRKASGHVPYNPHLPHEQGLMAPISDVTFTSSADPITDEPPSAADGWEPLPGSVNNGVIGAPHITMFQQRALLKRFDVELTWVPCACDVGERTICAYPVDTAEAVNEAVPIRGPTRCTVLHVLPALPPDFVDPSPADGQQFVFYMGREDTIPLSVLASSAQQRMDWRFHELPSGIECFRMCSLMQVTHSIRKHILQEIQNVFSYRKCSLTECVL